jgi:hypothetical protein
LKIKLEYQPDAGAQLVELVKSKRELVLKAVSALKLLQGNGSIRSLTDFMTRLVNVRDLLGNTKKSYIYFDKEFETYEGEGRSGYLLCVEDEGRDKLELFFWLVWSEEKEQDVITLLVSKVD